MQEIFVCSSIYGHPALQYTLGPDCSLELADSAALRTAKGGEKWELSVLPSKWPIPLCQLIGTPIKGCLSWCLETSLVFNDLCIISWVQFQGNYLAFWNLAIISSQFKFLQVQCTLAVIIVIEIFDGPHLTWWRIWPWSVTSQLTSIRLFFHWQNIKCLYSYQNCLQITCCACGHIHIAWGHKICP